MPRLITVRCVLLAPLVALLLAGCGDKEDPLAPTQKALVEQLVAQVHLEQARTAELRRQLTFTQQFQIGEAIVLVLLGGALAVTFTVNRDRRKPDAPK